MSNEFDDMPLPYDRELLVHQIDELEKAYHGRVLHDQVFLARSRTISNMLWQLESVHQAGDTERAGFLIAALLDRDMGERELQRHAWEKGMADAKLQALGIKKNVRNPYIPEGE